MVHLTTRDFGDDWQGPLFEAGQVPVHYFMHVKYDEDWLVLWRSGGAPTKVMAPLLKLYVSGRVHKVRGDGRFGFFAIVFKARRQCLSRCC